MLFKGLILIFLLYFVFIRSKKLEPVDSICQDVIYLMTIRIAKAFAKQCQIVNIISSDNEIDYSVPEISFCESKPLPALKYTIN